MGQYDDSAVVTRQIPTPKLEDMAIPDYGDFTPTGPADGLAGNPAIQNTDDAAALDAWPMAPALFPLPRAWKG